MILMEKIQMWYSNLFKKFAASKEEYLKSIEIDDNIINFILSQDEKIQNLLINAARKNKQITILELEQIINKYERKQIFYSPTKFELSIANRYNFDQNFYKWILNELRKFRTHKDKKGNYEYNFGDNDFIDELPQIYDWYNINNIDNIHNYSAQSAMKNQKEWHSKINVENESNYLPIDENDIVYGPKWKNDKYNGWTIQKVTKEQDLLAEGNNMNHCVGKYFDNVKNGKIDIYSLRDKQNNPHITLAMYGGTHSVLQYYGYGNSNPDKKYVGMIKEWFLSLGDVEDNSNISTIKDSSDFNSLYDVQNNIQDKIKIIEKDDKYDDYGFYQVTNNTKKDINDLLENIIYFLNQEMGPEQLISSNYNRSYIREIKQSIDSISSQLVKLSYLYSKIDLDNYINKKIRIIPKESALLFLMDKIYNEFNKIQEQIFDNISFDFSGDLTEEDMDEEIDYMMKKYIDNNYIALLYKNIIDCFDRDIEIKVLYNKLLEIIKEQEEDINE